VKPAKKRKEKPPCANPGCKELAKGKGKHCSPSCRTKACLLRKKERDSKHLEFLIASRVNESLIKLGVDVSTQKDLVESLPPKYFDSYREFLRKKKDNAERRSKRAKREKERWNKWIDRNSNQVRIAVQKQILDIYKKRHSAWLILELIRADGVTLPNAFEPHLREWLNNQNQPEIVDPCKNFFEDYKGESS
jgi:hypothetical protein